MAEVQDLWNCLSTSRIICSTVLIVWFSSLWSQDGFSTPQTSNLLPSRAQLKDDGWAKCIQVYPFYFIKKRIIFRKCHPKDFCFQPVGQHWATAASILKESWKGTMLIGHFVAPTKLGFCYKEARENRYWRTSHVHHKPSSRKRLDNLKWWCS